MRSTVRPDKRGHTARLYQCYIDITVVVIRYECSQTLQTIRHMFITYESLTGTHVCKFGLMHITTNKITYS